MALDLNTRIVASRTVGPTGGSDNSPAVNLGKTGFSDLTRFVVHIENTPASNLAPAVFYLEASLDGGTTFQRIAAVTSQTIPGPRIFSVDCGSDVRLEGRTDVRVRVASTWAAQASGTGITYSAYLAGPESHPHTTV